MTYCFQSPIVGAPPVEAVVPATAPTGVTPWPPVQLGSRSIVYDPVWGFGEVVFAKVSGTIRQFGLCTLTPTLNATTRQYELTAAEVTNAANLARSVVVSQAGTGNGATLTAGQFGWFMVSGMTPINGTASVAAASPVGITAAGQVGASSAGKEIESCVSILAGTNTVAKTAVAGASGANTIQFSNVDDFFVGGFLSGTGVGASAAITAIDPIQNIVTVSVVNSASVAGQTVTQTANNGTIFYNVVHMDVPNAQGRIT